MKGSGAIQVVTANYHEFTKRRNYCIKVFYFIGFDMKNFLTTAVFCLCVTPVYAIDIDFRVNAGFSYDAIAFDQTSARVAPSFAETGRVLTGAVDGRFDVLNTFESIVNTNNLTLTNTSTTDRVQVDWIVDGFAEISGSIQPDTVVDPTVFDLTSFGGVTGDIMRGAFASVRGNYACSAADLADPTISCDGFSDTQISHFSFFGFFELGPGESFSVQVEAAPLLKVTTDIPSSVPLPAGGVMLLSGLLGFGFLGRRRLSGTQ
ncbi:MAG: VPLPA-CTERM sorting domain-containing protein [Paracoccaceae bacterium]